MDLGVEAERGSGTLRVREPVSDTLVEVVVAPRIADHVTTRPVPNTPGHRDRVNRPAEAVFAAQR